MRTNHQTLELVPVAATTGAAATTAARPDDELATVRARRAAVNTAVEVVKQARDVLDTLEQDGVDSADAVVALAQILGLLYDFREFASGRDPVLDTSADQDTIAGLVAEAFEIELQLRTLDPPPRAVRAAAEQMLDRASLVLPAEEPVLTLIESSLDVDYVPGMLAAIESIYSLDTESLEAIEGLHGRDGE